MLTHCTDDELIYSSKACGIITSFCDLLNVVVLQLNMFENGTLNRIIHFKWCSVAS